MHSNFEVKFEAYFEVHFRHTIYCFEVREVMSLTLQTVYKLELKQRIYSHLKTTTQS